MPGVVAQVFNPNTWEVEAGRPLEFKASLVYIVELQPELYRENLSANKDVFLFVYHGHSCPW